MAASGSADFSFQVDPWVHFLGGLVERRPGLWTRLGNFETRMLDAELAAVAIEAPIYVAGMARSGSTLLLELLEWHTQTGSHRYRDFPMLYTPHLWNRFLDRVPLRRQAPAERAHRDGIFVSAESPEAFEEMLWMAFFPGLHDPARSAVLDADTEHPAFEAFYRDHLRKLLLVRRAQRYLSKANYNLTRLEYLLKLFPDARFVIPVRDPAWHIASLMKQHRLFCRGQQDNPRALIHLRRAGHFEFGLDRRPINVGDAGTVADIQIAWRNGAEVEGWAHYWNQIHGWLADRLEQSSALRAASLVVPYEALCKYPDRLLPSIFTHCRLEAPSALLERARERIRFPDYYRPGFKPEESSLIAQVTAATAARLGLQDGY